MSAATSRAAIFGRLREVCGADTVAARKAAALDWIKAHPCGVKPPVTGDLLARFCQRAELLSSSCVRLPDRTAAPAAVAHYLTAQALPLQAVIAPELAAIDWANAGLTVAARSAQGADAVGISGVFCAIAETGTLMLLSGPSSPATVSLLPETHIALLAASRIVPNMEDAFALLRAEHGSLPRSVNFVSGPSRTGDIEQTLVIGAHGPCRVHVLITAG